MEPPLLSILYMVIIGHDFKRSFQKIPFRSVPFLYKSFQHFKERVMRSFFFRNDGIILDRSVRSYERTIVSNDAQLLVVYIWAKLYLFVLLLYVSPQLRSIMIL